MLRSSIIFISIIAFLFFGLSRFMGIGEKGFEAASSLIMYPFLIAQRSLMSPISHWREQRQSKETVLRDLERSHEACEKLQQEIIQLKALINYQTNSKEVHDFLQRYNNSTTIVARVLLKNFEGTHFFLIEAGTQQGIEKDMIAVYKDCLVGRVIEVYPYYSKILLITDSACKISAYCADTNAQGVHEGTTLLDACKLNFVHNLDTVKEGDMVLSSGEGLIFPRGFALGRIKHQEYDGLHYIISVQPLIDFKKINYVCLVKNSVIIADQKVAAEQAL